MTAPRSKAHVAIRNVDRTVGTMLGHELTKATRGAGLPDDSIDLTFTGTAGQSLGAFVPRGITLRLIGDANDYLGKGLSGGRIVARPADDVTFDEQSQIMAGNVIGYGATSGEILLRGTVGERLCVRNSGATAIVEGVGDHACEYMTGGEALILGPTGRNVAAGMSGGLAYVLDLNRARLNTKLADPHTLDAAALERVRELLARHAAETGSTVAEDLLRRSDDELLWRFTMIVPRDYAKVVSARAAAQASGLSEVETTRTMMEATHG